MKYKFDEIYKVAKKIVDLVDQDRAVIIAMEGELGAGKTALTKELAKSLGVIDSITSPTFVLHSEYKVLSTQYSVLKTLQHIDVWRMESFDELERIGLQRMIEEKSIIVIEWADRFRDQIQSYPSTMLRAGKVKVVWVKMDYAEKEDERIILISN